MRKLSKYNKAINLYENSKFDEAIKLFKELKINKIKLNTHIYEIYISRCNEFIKNKPINFNAIYEHKMK